MGSTGPADAATESFMRYLAAEVRPQGRVCGIWTAGVAETLSDEKIAFLASDRAAGMTGTMANIHEGRGFG